MGASDEFFAEVAETKQRARARRTKETGWAEEVVTTRGVNPSGVAALRALSDCLKREQADSLTVEQLRDLGFMNGLVGRLEELALDGLAIQDDQGRWAFTQLGKDVLPHLEA